MVSVYELSPVNAFTACPEMFPGQVNVKGAVPPVIEVGSIEAFPLFCKQVSLIAITVTLNGAGSVKAGKLKTESQPAASVIVTV